MPFGGVVGSEGWRLAVEGRGRVSMDWRDGRCGWNQRSRFDDLVSYKLVSLELVAVWLACSLWCYEAVCRCSGAAVLSDGRWVRRELGRYGISGRVWRGRGTTYGGTPPAAPKRQAPRCYALCLCRHRVERSV